ncbi:hypothetical protein [Flavobacterium sp. JAS]|uniref:hypothetical protein n=1 Tax=Flavobacterium sp. JAS TaxID=2897329 RepID=UPI001E4E3005|nr:hypothetical protein [Flavobacterium sp. JAS]MCD0470719.1 hypothetical protein [Flavobacterium sp. JAS]
MKYIFVLLFIFSSCDNPRKTNIMNSGKKIPKENVIQNISILRKSGFFENFSKFSDKEIFEQLHSNRIDDYSKIFDKKYDPGMELDEFDLACIDKRKMIYLDLESDVCAENNVYVDVIKMFSNLSNGSFNPQNISEKWQSPSGPITVEFELNNEIIKFNPKYSDDWLDSIVFEICKEKIKANKTRIVECLGESKYGYGQNIAFMRITETEQNNLENNYKYKFRE